MKKSMCISLIAIVLFVLATPLYSQWVKTNEPSGAVFSLTVSGTSLLAGTVNGVFRSTDYGDTWNLTLPPTILPFVDDFALDSIVRGNRNLYAGGQGGVYISKDDGINWQAINSGLENSEVRSLAVIPNETEGSILLAGTTEGIFRSSDNGESWAPSGLTNLKVYAITVFKDEADSTIILTGIDREYTNLSNCIFHSSDNGQSWIESSSPTLWAGSFAIIPNETNGMNIFSGTYSSVYLSTNNGSDWTHISAGLNRSVYSLATYLNGASGNNIFAGTIFGGVFLSTNNGANWTAVNSGLSYENDYIYSLAVLDQYIFAGTLNPDGGVWRRPLSEMVTSVESDPENFPAQFILEQNYPNPFNPSTVISYRLPVSSDVTLKVYDVLGEEVATLVDEYKPAGKYEVEFNALSSFRLVRNLTSGTYFYQLRASSFIETKKMSLLK
ncbi:MAG: hypothetical protein DAHOPDDO_02325 [Ignavibacteriaceae bacterium]|nr:hypothetical protein [Ignavibacteriaceae bacterium]